MYFWEWSNLWIAPEEFTSRYIMTQYWWYPNYILSVLPQLLIRKIYLIFDCRCFSIVHLRELSKTTPKLQSRWYANHQFQLQRQIRRWLLCRSGDQLPNVPRMRPCAWHWGKFLFRVCTILGIKRRLNWNHAFLLDSKFQIFVPQWHDVRSRTSNLRRLVQYRLRIIFFILQREFRSLSNRYVKFNKVQKMFPEIIILEKN